MRFLLSALISFVLAGSAQAQLFPRIFHPRYRPEPYCPDCVPSDPSSPSIPHPDTIKPEPEPDLSQFEAVIPKDIRVRNRNGNCVWCALEDVFVAAGYDEVQGVTAQAIKEGWSGAGSSNVRSFLHKVKVEYKESTNRDYSIFDYAKKEGLAVYIQIPGHALCVVGMDDKNAYIIDNNPPLSVQRWTRSKFDRLWEGYACCPLFKKHRPKPEPIPAPTPQVGPAGPAGPQGPPGKDGAAADLKPLTDKINQLAANQNTLADTVGGIASRVNNLEAQMKVVMQPQLTPPSPGSNSAASPVRTRIIPESGPPQS